VVRCPGTRCELTTVAELLSEGGGGQTDGQTGVFVVVTVVTLPWDGGFLGCLGCWEVGAGF